MSDIAIANILSRIANIDCPDYISMCMESAFTSVPSITCMMTFTADRTCLACVCRVYIEDFDTCEFCLIFYVLCKAIETPVMKRMIVFTTCPCRRANVG